MAADWTAIGSIAGGFGAVAAFLAILATIAVYFFQSRADKAAAIRQNLQFLHGQQVQVVPSIESGLPAMIDRQVREFRGRLGTGTKPGYFLEELLGNGQHAGDRFLFRASAQDSNLSSAAYARMSGIWDEMNIKAFEFRGALRIFSYACETLAKECGPDVVAALLTGMGRDGAEGLLALRRAGAFTIAQDEPTSVIYGMPREAALLGAAERILPLSEIGAAIARVATKGWK